jgi:hypothetical protein
MLGDLGIREIREIRGFARLSAKALAQGKQAKAGSALDVVVFCEMPGISWSKR